MQPLQKQTCIKIKNIEQPEGTSLKLFFGQGASGSRVKHSMSDTSTQAQYFQTFIWEVHIWNWHYKRRCVLISHFCYLSVLRVLQTSPAHHESWSFSLKTLSSSYRRQLKKQIPSFDTIHFLWAKLVGFFVLFCGLFFFLLVNTRLVCTHQKKRKQTSFLACDYRQTGS